MMAHFFLQGKLQLLACSDAGYAYRFTEDIVLKCSITKGDPRTGKENSIFDVLEQTYIRALILSAAYTVFWTWIFAVSPRRHPRCTATSTSDERSKILASCKG
jgi:hypothetical protein